MDKLLKVPQVAELLGLSVSTIYKKYENGILPGLKIGTSVRFSLSDIDAYIKKIIYDQRNKSDNENLWRF